MKERTVKILSLSLAVALIAAPIIGVSAANTANNPTAVEAKQQAKEKSETSSYGKEEVVYVNLNEDGSLKDIYVVNNINGTGELTDYGDYTQLKNLSTTDDLSVKSKKVNLPNTDGERFYYQGKLENKEVPWSVETKYKLDGKPISGQELAGSTGKLDITISIKQNPKTDDVYKDHFALQGSVTLDSDKISGLKAPDATVANSGSNKLLSYIILPGKDKEISISADVKDFEMDAIMFNALPLTLSIDDPDTDELKDRIFELQDGAVELDDGARELDDGALEMDDGATELDEGADDLNEGVQELADGVDDLVEGVDELVDGVDELYDGADKLNDGAGKLRNGSESLTYGVDQVYKGASAIEGALNTLGGNSQDLVLGAKQLEQGILMLQNQLPELTGKDIDKVAQGILAYQFAAGKLDSTIAQLEATVNQLNYAIGENPEAILGMSADEYTIYKTAYAAGQRDVLVVVLGQLKETQNSIVQANSRFYSKTGIDLLTADASQLTAGMMIKMSTVKQGIDALSKGAAQLSQGLEQYTGGVDTLADKSKDYTHGINKLSEGAEELLKGGKELKEGTVDLLEGSEKLKDGTGELKDGTDELQDGVVELQDGAVELKDGTVKLKDGTIELKDGTLELIDGTGRLRDETADMDTEVDEEIEKLLDEYRSNDFDIPSFADSRNKDMDSLQFVIRTPEINKEEVSEVVVAESLEQPDNFWQRLVLLFKKED